MQLNSKIIFHILGLLLVCNGGFMLFAVLVSAIYSDGATFGIGLDGFVFLFLACCRIFFQMLFLI